MYGVTLVNTPTIMVSAESKEGLCPSPYRTAVPRTFDDKVGDCYVLDEKYSYSC